MTRDNYPTQAPSALDLSDTIIPFDIQTYAPARKAFEEIRKEYTEYLVRSQAEQRQAYRELSEILLD